MADAKHVKKELASNLRQAAIFRESKIAEGCSSNPKNQYYAGCLDKVVAYVESLPDDDPMLQAIDECGFLPDWGSGCSVPENEWNYLIHCDASDPAAWFEEWASHLVEHYKDGDWRHGAICDQCDRSYDPEWMVSDLPSLPPDQVDDDVLSLTLEELRWIGKRACPECFEKAYRDIEARRE